MSLLAADFKADLLVIARQHLEQRWPSKDIPDNDVLPRYFDSLRRWPAARPRKVWLADDFRCAEELATGWRVLQAKVIHGDDLAPHLSEGHLSLNNLDGMLNEWGVHHLHLGTKPWSRKPSLVERTKYVLFALIADDHFYAIDFFPHTGWESTSIVEALHRNWPQTIHPYRVKGVPGEVLHRQARRQLRVSNVQTFTGVRDGTFYAPIRGGVACSGVSIEAVRRAARACEDIKRLQIAMQEQIEKVIVQLRPRGYSDGQDIQATLIGVNSLGYDVLFPEFGVRANIKLEQEVSDVGKSESCSS